MSRTVILPLLGLAFAAGAGPALAQVVGPPIPPDQILRQQNQPLPPPPSIPVPAQPVPPASPPQAAPAQPRSEPSQGRAAWCQHQATVDRVPQSQRASYIHHCMSS
jgi:hypothetical protein